MQFKKLVVLLFLLVMSGALLQAQEQGTTFTGVVDICGEDALTINALDDLPEDATTQALDALLVKFVTFPADGEEALQHGAPAPGAVIYVETPEGTYFRSIGVGDLETCAPIAPDNVFPIGSNTKMFTAAVIFQLQEEGLLSTGDLVSDYLPEEIALFEGAEPITIDMLLGHTSGLPDYLNSQAPTSLGSMLSGADADAVSGKYYSPRELLENSAESDTLLFAPGTEAMWSYSNDGYIMLGMIIEKVTGQTYVDAVTERIIEPLGMENTVVLNDVAPAELGLVKQYLIDPDAFVLVREFSDWNFSQAWSAGSVVSTPADMSKFLRAYYSGDLFQNAETLDALTTRAAPSFAAESDDFYYMHGGYYKAGFLGHGGQTLGTESDPGYNPEYDVVIVTWANTAYAYTGGGVFHVGNAIGLTPSYKEVIGAIQQKMSGSQEPVELPPAPPIANVTGLTFNVTAITFTDTGDVKTPAEGSTYSITLNDDGTANIVADCNTVMASYTGGEDGTIDFEPGPSTLVACPEGSLSDDVLQVLGDVERYIITEDDTTFYLILQTADNSMIVSQASK